jgi:2-phospho-L-lactate/phosphoenolpyruvate guanylyltransferase
MTAAPATMRTAAILPVKRFSSAKQRLGAEVQEGLRDALVRTMLADVLEALTATPAIELTIIVSGQTRLPDWSGPRLTVIEDRSEQGQSAAASLGVERALDEGFERVLCVPGDCPALSAAELQELLAEPAANGPEVVIVPDRHGSGTNGLLLSPPDAIAPSFGPGSFERHRSLVLADGAALRVRRPPSLLLDIDTDVDLQELRLRLAGSSGGARRTRALLAEAHAGPDPLPPTPRARSGGRR